MTQISVSELQRRFGEVRHQARREPVEITRHGRREFVLMSAEHYDWLAAAAKRTHWTADKHFLSAGEPTKGKIVPLRTE
jgi:prevent-host-death family protein